MLNLTVPTNVQINIENDFIFIKGPLGCKKKKKSKNIELFFDKNTNKLWLLTSDLKEKHFYLSILNKMILGVAKGFSVKLNIVGIGYKVFLENQILNFKLGVSHSITYPLPKDVSVKILNQKVLTLVIFGNDLQKITQIAAEIRALRKADPYKGKGIKYSNEIIKKKEGKKTNV
jgi:large subunit ribosomal protein L6